MKIVAFDPNERPSLEEIRNHNWMKNPICSDKEIEEEFRVRKERLSLILAKKRT